MRSGLRAGAGKREKAGAGGGAACGSKPALGRLPSWPARQGKRGAVGLVPRLGQKEEQ